MRGRRLAPAPAFALALALALLAGAAQAHRLVVFAAVEGGVVVVEARFSNGNPAEGAAARVFDAGDRLILETATGEDGTARVSLDGLRANLRAGLRVEVETGEGHSDYWILSADDLARAAG